MTILATDNFDNNGANLGANWTDISAGWSVVSQEASGVNDATENSALYTGTTFPNDQWSQCTVGSVVVNTTDEGVGPIVRGQAGGDMLFLQCNTVETRVYVRVSGGFTQKGTDGPAVATGDVLYLEVQGSTIIAKKNGTSICGSPIAGSGLPALGNAGLWSFSGVGTAPKADVWSAGDFAGGGSALQESEWNPIGPQPGPLSVSTW